MKKLFALALLVWSSLMLDVASATPVIELAVGQSLLHPLGAPARRVALADPEVAEIVGIDDTTIYLLGKKSGRTNLIVWPRNQAAAQRIELRVSRDVSALRDLLAMAMPDETRLQIVANGDKVVLSGELVNAVNHAKAAELATQFAGEGRLLNLLPAAAVPQVLLEVKVAEISKTLIDRLGAKLELSSSGSRTVSFLGDLLSGGVVTLSSQTTREQITLDAEERKGLVKILAEPSIMALSGQQGEFLAGGRLFIPVSQFAASGGTSSGAITLEEREFGVGVKFLPTVLADGRINLRLNAEVSEVSTVGTQLTTEGQRSVVLPTITSRQTSTTVQLQDGQSFAIGGLTRDNVQGSITALPGLGSIPLLGALFRSTDFQNDRSELVFVVTARIVREPTSIKLPTDGFVMPNRSERFVEGALESKP